MSRHRPLVGRTSKGEHSAVSRGNPVAGTIAVRGHTDNRRIEMDASDRSFKFGIAEAHRPEEGRVSEA